MRGKSAFSRIKRLRLWRKMNTCQSENSFHAERIFASTPFVEKQVFFND